VILVAALYYVSVVIFHTNIFKTLPEPLSKCFCVY